MREKIKIIITGLVIAFVIFTIAVVAYDKNKGPEVDIDAAVVADLHYISPEVTDNGTAFRKTIDKGDGKVLLYSEELTDTLMDQLAESKKDNSILIMAGDLTFNGDKPSHKALADKLRRLEKTGVKVLVTPGNHDINCSSAASYNDDMVKRLQETNSWEFERIYQEFGYDEAIARDSDSLSYVYEVNKKTRILMIDSNSQGECKVTDETIRWMRKQLEAAQEAGVSVVAAGHQTLYETMMFSGGFVMVPAEEVQSLFAEYGVKLYLSGHTHMQHAHVENRVNEITTSALCIAPNQYGLISSSGKRIHYETRKLEMKVDGIEDFGEYAESVLDSTYIFDNDEALNKLGLDQESQVDMNEFAREATHRFISGNMRGFDSLDPDRHLREMWARTRTIMGSYLNYMDEDIDYDYTEWNIK